MKHIELIKAEIERLKGQLIRGACSSQVCMETNCKEEAYNEVLAFIDSLPEDEPSEDLIEESKTLYNDIDSCITELLKARTEKDQEAEGMAMFRMEGLMVGTLQHLSCIIDRCEPSENIGQLEFLRNTAIEMIAALEHDISILIYDGKKGHDPEAEKELEQWKSALIWLGHLRDSKKLIEPSEELEEEIEKYYYEHFAFLSNVHIPTLTILSNIAKYFYELGFNARKK